MASTRGIRNEGNPPMNYYPSNSYNQAQVVPPNNANIYNYNNPTPHSRTSRTIGDPNNFYGGDPEKITADLPIDLRNGFIRKVYTILAIQVSATFAIASIFQFSTEAALWLATYYWIGWIAFAVAFVLMMTMVCVPSVGRRYPVNYIVLGVITFCYSIIVAIAGVATQVSAFWMAAGITLAVFLGLTFFAIQTKWDFTGCGPYIMVIAIIMMIFALVSIFWRNHILHLVYASLGAAFISFIIVFDTQMIVGGKHRKYQYSLDDYAFAALTLYLDIINLFLFILDLISAADR